MVEIKKPDFENMSDNKKNFIIWIIVFVILLFIFMIYISLSWGNKNNHKKITTKWDFVIWTVWEDSSFSQFIEKIKQKHWLKSTNIQVVNFPDYNSYYYSLNSAFLKWQAPDIFVINNNDNYYNYEEKIFWFTPKELSVSDFRKKFDWVFSKNLIKTYTDNWKKIEYVAWVPLSYETLWVIYNSNLLREISWNVNRKIQTFSWIEEIINTLEENNSYTIPVWLGNSKVYFASDIIANLILSLWDNYVWWSKTSKAISAFIQYWNTKKSFNKAKKSDIELFKEWKLAMIFAYPRILWKISNMDDSDWVKASFFPAISSNNSNTLVNYNYYVVNYNSKNPNLAKTILIDFLNPKIVWEYFSNKQNNYSFPALLSLKDQVSEKIVNNAFDIYLKDFENKRYVLKSFDKKLKFFFDDKIKNILDKSIYDYQLELQKFNRQLNCLTDKISHLKNLENNCWN